MEEGMAFSGPALGEPPLGGAGHGRCLYRLFAGVRCCFETAIMKRGSFSAIASVAYKEFLHIYRDRRVLILLLILPPVFTLVFGHAFEAGEMTDVPAMLVNRDGSPRAERFIDLVLKNKTFHWRIQPPTVTDEEDLLGQGVEAALVIPPGWNDGL